MISKESVPPGGQSDIDHDCSDVDSDISSSSDSSVKAAPSGPELILELAVKSGLARAAILCLQELLAIEGPASTAIGDASLAGGGVGADPAASGDADEAGAGGERSGEAEPSGEGAATPSPSELHSIRGDVAPALARLLCNLSCNLSVDSNDTATALEVPGMIETLLRCYDAGCETLLEKALLSAISHIASLPNRRYAE